MAMLFGLHPESIDRLTPGQMRVYHRWIEAHPPQPLTE